ncbi:DegT/DnrJ/EryC1/StrS family aminotransferase [Endozoicomonas ascidiicola]|uniref:DegT/DnrJ/EryC1/StrS family aminotransferase n=1 Tax=Endozoicomonas ascidiicola TaxID=1698521 RepID=UPI000835EE73|nr:DegT/DnrJ/EryC1/StrS family aminotransferase [Endozoicomonas ascidiicola]
MNNIPMVDIQLWHKTLQSELEEKAISVLRSGRFIMGEEVEAFEKEAANYLGARHAISCANGTDALILALHAAGIGPGDEVLTTGFTFFATAEAILRVGAKPVLVDIDSQTFNIDPVELERSITSHCKAVIVVHLFGLPAPMDAIRAVCDRHALLILEDCAQSFGAAYGSRKTGCHGLLGAFSFFPSKNLGGFGDGGLVITQDHQTAETIQMLRNHGSNYQYHHECTGYNSRLDAIQAAMLRVKLKYIDQFNNQRRQVAQWYGEYLQKSEVICPIDTPEHVYHQYTVVLPARRDTIKKKLANKGIASAIYYPMPLNKQKALSSTEEDYELPVCEQLSEHCLSLPIFPGMTEEQVKQVADALIAAM